MSIKIYEAYRVIRGVDPFDLLWEIKRVGQAQAKKRLTRLFRDILQGKAQRAAERDLAEDEAFRSWIGMKGIPLSEHKVYSLLQRWRVEACPEEFKTPSDSIIAVTHATILKKMKLEHVGGDLSVFDLDRWAQTMYGEQLTNHQRDVWALDVSVTLRTHRGRYYLIPYCERSSYVGGTLDFLAKHKHLEEFGYWDNSDKPEEVTSSQWARRSKIWTHLTEPERWAEHITLDIVSWQAWEEVSPKQELRAE